MPVTNRRFNPPSAAARRAELEARMARVRAEIDKLSPGTATGWDTAVRLLRAVDTAWAMAARARDMRRHCLAKIARHMMTLEMAQEIALAVQHVIAAETKLAEVERALPEPAELEKLWAATKQQAPLPRTFKTVVSSDPVAGVVRAIINLAQDAAPRDPPRRGPKDAYDRLHDLLEFIEKEWFQIGMRDGKRVGTADKGALATGAAKEMNISTSRAADLARQIADITEAMPEAAGRLIGK